MTIFGWYIEVFGWSGLTLTYSLGARAELLFSSKHPVYFRYSSHNGVLKLQFTREARSLTGELLLSATTSVVNLVEKAPPVVGSGSLAATEGESESDGLI